MGKIFYDMGLPACAAVVECSASDLVGQYVGQTCPKTQKMLEKALGKVLFIDEAYRLAEGQFAQEAMDELVDCLTKPKFAQKLIVILAGYDEDINRLMLTNTGLTSRFPETISFKHLSPGHCLELFQKSLQKGGKLNSTAIQQPSTTFEHTLLELFENLAQLPGWGNARDIVTLAKSVTTKVLSIASVDTGFEITEDIVLSAIRHMVSERKLSQESVLSPSRHPMLPVQQQFPAEDVSVPPAITTLAKAAAKEDQPPPPPPPLPGPPSQQNGSRDPDVSEEIWAQLQSDKRAAEEHEQRHQELLTAEEKVQEGLHKKAAAQEEARRKAEEESNAEARRLLEQERLKAELE